MRRLYLAYLLAVVLPAALTIGGGVVLADRAWAGLRRASQARAGRMALTALEQDLEAAVADLTSRAEPIPTPDSTDLLVASALAGDTANVLVPGPEGMEVRVAVPAAPDDATGTVRAASAPLPSSTAQVGRATGYRTALYLSGQRWDATDPPPGPPQLDAGLLGALAGSPGGVPFADAEAEGMLLSLTGRAGTAPAFAVLIAAPRPGGTALPPPLLLVMGLLLVFASLAGWIQLTGDARGGRPLSLLLLSLVPTLTALGFMVHADRLYRDAATDANRRDLTRALAVARVRDVAQEPSAIHGLTGFHAYRVLKGRVVAASLDGPTEAVAALPAPPPSFTSAGSVLTPEGEAAYVALRLSDGGFIVAAVVPTEERMAAFGRISAWAGSVLCGWLLLVAAILGTRRSRVSS